MYHPSFGFPGRAQWPKTQAQALIVAGDAVPRKRQWTRGRGGHGGDSATAGWGGNAPKRTAEREIRYAAVVADFSHIGPAQCGFSASVKRVCRNTRIACEYGFDDDTRMAKDSALWMSADLFDGGRPATSARLKPADFAAAHRQRRVHGTKPLRGEVPKKPQTAAMFVCSEDKSRSKGPVQRGTVGTCSGWLQLRFPKQPRQHRGGGEDAPPEQQMCRRGFLLRCACCLLCVVCGRDARRGSSRADVFPRTIICCVICCCADDRSDG